MANFQASLNDRWSPSAQKTHLSGFARWIANYRFSGKMSLLLLIVIICTIAGSLIGGISTKNAIQHEIEYGLINQVTALRNQLSNINNEEPAKFLELAKHVLYGSRWENDKSGYAFLINRQGQLLIYPPKPEREGGHLDSVKVNNTEEDVNQAFARIGRGNDPVMISYPYVKPGTDKRITKIAYVYPMGDYMVVSGVYIDRADAAFYSYLTQSSIQLVIVMLILSVVVYLFKDAIGQQVNQSVSILDSIAHHDLTQTVEITGKDEFTQITKASDEMRLALATMLQQQRGISLSLASAATQMSTGMYQVGEAVVDEREKMDSVATAMEEMSTTVREVAQNATEVSEATQTTDRLATSGVQQIREAINSMNQLFENLSTSADSVNSVEQKVLDIGSVVDTIRGISEQTNLLALNAAIEAARAGEQGRGFAVVADEVRSLASRTQNATGEIAAMINSLQQSTRQAVNLMQTSIDAANSAVDSAQKANSGFEEIAVHTGQLAERSELIASAAEQQGVVANQVADSLLTIRDAVEETEQVVKELSIASQTLNNHAQSMDEMVRQYKLPNGQS